MAEEVEMRLERGVGKEGPKCAPRGLHFAWLGKCQKVFVCLRARRA